ncbi:MAG: glucan biosynthesis protein [Candidatus Poribacteria bacterium]|nr:MAG: glucan biosynthesis protein [Candidatus Poribacteria bacterium]
MNHDFSRRHDFDALRASMMLLGILLHGALSFAPIPWVVQDSRQHEAFALLFSAVHGFRMPVFFLMSGFFTAMLWRKRGMKGTLKHRFQRIVLPFLLSLVTVLPLLNWVSFRAIASGSAAPTAERSPQPEAPPGEDLWTAAASGNLRILERRLSEGADPNAPDPVAGVTPLAWTALFGQEAAAEKLLDHGADPNARNRDGTTPLHAAAFLGRAEVAALLPRYGADPTAPSYTGETPLDSLTASWEAVQYIAGLLNIPVERAAVEAGRKKVAELLQQTTTGRSVGASVRRWIARQMNVSLFHHLWFLWFLIWLIAGFSCYALFVERTGWKGLPRRWLAPPRALLWLIPLTMLPQHWMGRFGPSFGPDTSAGLIPMPHVLAYYAIFFFYGALLFDREEPTWNPARGWGWMLLAGLCVFLPLGLRATFTPVEALPQGWRRPLADLLQVGYTWTMTFGLMGMFRRLLRRESYAVRYVSDSSYWLYLVHLPLIIAAQMVVRNWKLPALVKYGIVCGSVTVLLLLSYQLMVRYTWIGRMLNGPRTRRQKTAPIPASGG